MDVLDVEVIQVDLKLYGLLYPVPYGYSAFLLIFTCTVCVCSLQALCG